jgi:hypothetical protein
MIIEVVKKDLNDILPEKKRCKVVIKIIIGTLKIFFSLRK